MARHREEVLNVLLAQHLLERAIDASPENIERLVDNTRAMPDVIFTTSGVRCCIEGKFADASNARVSVENDIAERLETGVCLIGIAVIYPADLRTMNFAKADSAIEAAQLNFRIASESGDSGWNTGPLETLVAEMRRSFDLLVSDNVVSASVERLLEGMAPLNLIVIRNDAAAERLATILGVYQPTSASDEDVPE